MNVKDYIASGIIEQYILGDVSPQEKQEVECMSHIYPEIQAEILQVQEVLEAYAMDNAIEAPKHIKQNIFEQIEKESQAIPIVTAPNTAKVVAINKEETIVKAINYKKYLAAASVIFVVAMAAMFIALNNNNKENQLAANKKIEVLEKTLASTEKQLENLSVINTQSYVLKGNAKAPEKTLTVIWNKQTGNVFVNNVSLPQTPTNKQYQLWALKDGKPIDLGVFDVTTTTQTMKNIQGMQAFAVTLEDKGGSPSPHLEQLYAILNI
jgi:anti-sigma-K factor RskA